MQTGNGRGRDPTPTISIRILSLPLRYGVQMVYVIAWILMGAGALIAVTRLIKLAKTWAKPEMTLPGARSGAWADICIGTLPIFVAGAVLTEEAKEHAAVWAVLCAGLPIVGITFFLLIRSDLQRRRAGGQ